MLLNLIKTAGAKGLSQLTILLAMPIVTAIYQPEAVGGALTLLAYASIVTATGTLGYHLAIPIAKDDNEVKTIISICSLLALGTAVIFIIVITTLIDAGGGHWSALIVGFFVFVSTNISVSTQLRIREQLYTKLAIFYIIQSVSAYGSIIMIGRLGPATVDAFLIGIVLGNAVGWLYLMCRKNSKRMAVPKTIPTKKHIIEKYKKFPYFSAPTLLLNSTGSKIPIILVGALYGAKYAGIYGMVEKVALAPVSLLGASFSNVYVGEMAAARRTDCSLIVKIFNKALFISVAISFVISIMLFSFSELVSDLIFSDDWYDAGRLLKVFSFLIFFRIIAACVGRVFTILNRQNIALWWNVVRVVLVSAALVGAGLIGKDFYSALVTYTVSSIIMDSIVVILSYYVCLGYREKVI